MKKYVLNLLVILLSIVITVVLFAGRTVFASGMEISGYDSHLGSIHLSISDNKTFEDEMSFRLYKVADINEDKSSFLITDNFLNAGLEDVVGNISLKDYSKKTAGDKMELASYLEKFVVKESVPADYEEKVYKGKAEFDNLSSALYLIRGVVDSDDKMIIYQPALISMPEMDNLPGNLIYDINADIKAEKISPTDKDNLPGQAVDATGESKGVKTGDTGKISLYAGMLIIDIGVVCIIICAIARRKEE